MAPVAAVLCGKYPPLAEAMVKLLAPKIQIVHVCTTTETAVVEIPALLKGEAVTPVSGLGSNNISGATPRSDISLILVGGGYPQEELNRIRNAVDAVKAMPYFWADAARSPPGSAPGPPPPDALSKRIMDSIEGEEKGDGVWAPGLYRF